ncbi:MAG TPA: riboflavin biosynthesis protein RibF [Victivallales bacterium]|nr:riboflavin biosynthesis protein RibF [Victivallales bacterium]
MHLRNKDIIEVSSLDELHKYNIRKVSVAIGVFDGVHLGHRHLLGELSSESRRNGSLPVAVTFFPHPRLLIKPDQKLQLLVPHHQKLELLKEAGMSAVVTIAFTEEFSKLSPEGFLESFLSPGQVELLSVFVGSGWRFGRAGAGNTQTLAKFAENRGFSSKIIKELKTESGKISSSAIRRAIALGDLSLAEKMLGRSYSIFGKVVPGLSFASEGLGFPTANIEIKDGVVPPEGVYSGSAIVKGTEYPSAISIGRAQSVKHENKRRNLLIEVHILNFSGSIYGEEIEVKFGNYLREQRYFSEMGMLSEQISRDVDAVMEINRKKTGGA